MLKKNIKSFLFIILLVKADGLLWAVGCYGDTGMLNLKTVEVDILIWTGVAYIHLEKTLFKN